MSEKEESVAIFWDYENCELPASADGFTIASGIRNIAHKYGSVKVFKAYFEMSELTSQRSISARSELQSCGVSLIDCPHNGRKDVADKMMLVDMLAHAIDNPSPSTIVLISGDRDFVYAVSILRLRKYRVVVLAPTATHASLKAQASVVYDWPRHVLPLEPALDGPSHAATGTGSSSAWTSHSHDGHGQVNLSNARTGLFTPPDSAHTTPTSATRSYFTLSVPHIKGSTTPHSRSSTGYHHRPSASASSSASAGSCLSGVSFGGSLAGTTYSDSSDSLTKEDTKVFDLSHRFRESSTASSNRPRWPTLAELTLTHGRQSERSSLDEVTRGSTARGTLGANNGFPPTDSIAPLPSQSYIPACIPAGPSPEPLTDAHYSDDNDSASESDRASSIIVPTVTMTRLRAPPHKYRTLVNVLERERVQGNTRVAFSQLGSMLRAEDQNVYKRTGARQLRDYAEMAEEDGIVILGTSNWENGNRWTALHPTYHGKPPEAQAPQAVGF